MKVLISPTSLEESHIVAQAGTDILDVKNTKEGSLGAQMPWILKDVVDAYAGNDMLISATLGDLPFKPGTAALAAYGAAKCGVNYLKAGLWQIANFEEAKEVMDAVVQATRMVSDDIIVVAAGYADFKRFGGLDYKTLIRSAKASQSDVVMLDTLIKDGKSLFDALSLDELAEFVQLSHQSDMKVALAGSIKAEHIQDLASIGTDIIGVRGAVCPAADRSSGIQHELVKQFMHDVEELSALSS
jgi:hypothetical protein